MLRYCVSTAERLLLTWTWYFELLVHVYLRFDGIYSEISEKIFKINNYLIVYERNRYPNSSNQIYIVKTYNKNKIKIYDKRSFSRQHMYYNILIRSFVVLFGNLVVENVNSDTIYM